MTHERLLQRFVRTDQRDLTQHNASDSWGLGSLLLFKGKAISQGVTVDPSVHADSDCGQPPQTDDPPRPPVLLYDGVCAFCHRTIRTILRFDRSCTLRFAALDSEFARGIIGRHPWLNNVDSVVFVDSPGGPTERVDIRSAAVLRLVHYLGGPWNLLLVFGLVPRRLRDGFYDRVAANRYRIFGRYDSCPVPAAAVRARFLDTNSDCVPVIAEGSPRSRPVQLTTVASRTLERISTRRRSLGSSDPVR